MKQFLFLLFLVSITPNVWSQEVATSGAFVHLTQVDKPPFSAACTVRTSACTAAVIEKFLLENITAVGPLSEVDAEKTEIPVRVIIDTTGKVSWASVRGLPEETGNRLAALLKEMPSFDPGENEGKKANVIVDLRPVIYLSEPENQTSEVVFSEQTEQQPVWKNCRKAKDPQACTTTAINDWMNRNVRVSAIKESGHYQLTASFVVDIDGEVGRIVVLGGGDDFATEVIKQLKKMPRFEPGKDAGEPVAVSYILPMSFMKS